MNQLLFIETFVLGASTIAAIYHFVLYIQQRDKFLIFYSAYLFSLSCYILFKLISNNYDPFIPTQNVSYYIFEEILQVSMVSVYALFAAQTLEITGQKSIVRTLMYSFFVLSAVSIIYHTTDALIYGPGFKSHEEYAISRISFVGVATIALLFAWRIRRTTFQRTIIIGSLVYDCSGLLSIISFTQNTDILGLTGVEPYLAGCLLDIIIFSSALGYRLKTIAIQKNELLKKESDSRLEIERTRMNIAANLHDDIGSVLSSMSIYSEAAKNSIQENKTAKSIELLDKIGLNARETMGSMSDIVWTINPLNDSGIRLFEKMESFASSIFGSMNIEMEFNLGHELKNHDFSMKSRQNIYLIFKEIVNNCARHAEAQKVNINLRKNGLNCEMEIIDNGKGFDPTQQSSGNGLKNLQNRANELNGKIDFISNESGTSVLLIFPIS